MKLSEAVAIHPISLQGVDDILCLSDYNEASLLQTLRDRYLQVIYFIEKEKKKEKSFPPVLMYS